MLSRLQQLTYPPGWRLVATNPHYWEFTSDDEEKMPFRRPEKHVSFREFVARMMELDGEPAAERWLRSVEINVNHATVQDARKELQLAQQGNRSVMDRRLGRGMRHWRPEDLNDFPKGWKYVGSGGSKGFHLDGKNVGATTFENFLAKAFEVNGEDVMYEWCRNHDVRPTDPEYIKAFKLLKGEEEPKYNLELDHTKTKKIAPKSDDFWFCRQGEQPKMGGPRATGVSGAAPKDSPSEEKKAPPQESPFRSAAKPSGKVSPPAGVLKPSPKAAPMAGVLPPMASARCAGGRIFFKSILVVAVDFFAMVNDEGEILFDYAVAVLHTHVRPGLPIVSCADVCVSFPSSRFRGKKFENGTSAENAEFFRSYVSGRLAIFQKRGWQSEASLLGVYKRR